MTADRISAATATDRPVLICLLGSFRVIKAGVDVGMRAGGKTAALLTNLALSEHHRVSRRSLLGVLWPDTDESQAAHALTSMVHTLRDSLGDVLAGAAPVVYRAGAYELNIEAGVGVDVAHFEEFDRAADRFLQAGETTAGVRSLQAIDLYHGDICTSDDVSAVIERERLRALHLSLLSRLADEYFRRREYAEALSYACPSPVARSVPRGSTPAAGNAVSRPAGRAGAVAAPVQHLLPDPRGRVRRPARAADRVAFRPYPARSRRRLTTL